ncbi:TetR/AcrR family transcriptional regulator [Knoellia sp. CPCC 206435]|uniref:TetR/AcrR family transcriptional regulator n=1 Tax=Knoellia terrae TaxID=3404797 RepID=UPI003B4368D9
MAPTERSRDRIMAAASELAKERGVAGATIAQVCQRSGLPVSSVYWHFEDKDHLFAEVIRTSFARWLVTVPRWEVTADTTIEEGLRRVLGQSSRTFTDMPAFLRIGMQVLLDTGEQNVKTREAYLQVREQVGHMIAAWMGDLLPENVGTRTAEDLAGLVVAFSDGMVVGSQVYPSWEPDEYVTLLAGTIASAIESRS